MLHNVVNIYWLGNTHIS